MNPFHTLPPISLVPILILYIRQRLCFPSEFSSGYPNQWTLFMYIRQSKFQLPCPFSVHLKSLNNPSEPPHYIFVCFLRFSCHVMDVFINSFFTYKNKHSGQWSFLTNNCCSQLTTRGYLLKLILTHLVKFHTISGNRILILFSSVYKSPYLGLTLTQLLPVYTHISCLLWSILMLSSQLQPDLEADSSLQTAGLKSRSSLYFNL
jgi:hypothetical protein